MIYFRVSALEVKMRKEVDEAREQFEQEKKVTLCVVPTCMLYVLMACLWNV